MEGSDQAEWFFIGAAEEVGTQTLSMEIPTSTSATQTEVAVGALEAHMDAGNFHPHWLSLAAVGLGFSVLAGAWLIYQKNSAGVAETALASAQGTKDIEEVKETPAQPVMKADGCWESSPQKDWTPLPAPRLGDAKEFVPKPQASEHMELPSKEDAVNRKVALACASALLLMTGCKVAGTRILGRRANLEMFSDAVKVQLAKPGLPTKPLVLEKPAAMPPCPARSTFPDVAGPMVLDSIRCSDANIEILQKQKFQRTAEEAKVLVANGIVRPVPPTSCHIFRILPKQ